MILTACFWARFPIWWGGGVRSVERARGAASWHSGAATATARHLGQEATTLQPGRYRRFRGQLRWLRQISIWRYPARVQRTLPVTLEPRVQFTWRTRTTDTSVATTTIAEPTNYSNTDWTESGAVPKRSAVIFTTVRFKKHSWSRSKESSRSKHSWCWGEKSEVYVSAPRQSNSQPQFL